jgi:hypothetical protein
MSLACRLLAHAPIPSRLWNAGYYFTTCARCECDLIRRGGRWTRVPAGYRVVWRKAAGPPVDWTPWSPAKLRKDPSLTELLAAVLPGGPAAERAELIVDQRADAADLYRRSVA